MHVLHEHHIGFSCTVIAPEGFMERWCSRDPAVVVQTMDALSNSVLAYGTVRPVVLHRLADTREVTASELVLPPELLTSPKHKAEWKKARAIASAADKTFGFILGCVVCLLIAWFRSM